MMMRAGHAAVGRVGQSNAGHQQTAEGTQLYCSESRVKRLAVCICMQGAEGGAPSRA